MASHQSPEALVRDLVDAENHADARTVDNILAADFSELTRGRGVDQSRADALHETAHPKNQVHRTLVEPSIWTRTSGELAVVRSIVETTDLNDPAAAKNRFRNTHVFVRQDGEWRCVSWQVTKLNG